MTDFIPRIGHGYDVHRLIENRDLIIGGVKIPHKTGLSGHSDADVLLHAISDALLGAAALGDIGAHFPDTDDKWLGADSKEILLETVRILNINGFTVSNIDSIIVAQKPKMADYIPKMRENIAKCVCIPVNRVSVKATTEEKLGFTGNESAISAHAVAMIFEKL
ncbi:MAG: 2-C-methyl-D-erythritol 2,4-cyclodiphosphate synthase [Clostridia bacterium]|nr:2-C-methyl-D-erythritol 2,4-cyclodiphosphate synthase [Clostridia bacterium]